MAAAQTSVPSRRSPGKGSPAEARRPRPPRSPSKRGSGLSSGNSMAGGDAAALGGNPPRHMPGAGCRPSPRPAGPARLPVGGPGAGPALMAAL